MSKHPTKPGFPVNEEADLDSKRHRSCGPARQALAATEELSRRMDEHAAADTAQLSALGADVGEIRDDVKGLDKRIDDVNKHVDDVRDEVKQVSAHVGDLRVDMARTLEVVSSIGNTLADQREVRRVKMVAEVSTDTADKIAIIQDSADVKKTRREIWKKVVLSLIGLVAGYLTSLLIR